MISKFVSQGIMVMQRPAAKYLLFVMKLKNILLNCRAGLTNIIVLVWKKTFYGALEISVQDPFGNKLSFNEYIKEQ